MQTDCNANQLAFQAFNRRTVSGFFDGDHITSDAGGLLRKRPRNRFLLPGRPKRLGIDILGQESRVLFGGPR